MSTVNMDAVMEKVMGNRKVIEAFEKEARKTFEKRKEEVIKDFAQSPITMEIEAGPSSSNISATLGGYGNLFSYIGFYADESPIDPIRKYLNNLKFTVLKKEVNARRGNVSLSFRLKWFDMDVIEALSPMPWERGNSWIRGVEKGISGFSYYMFGTFIGSRSGKAKQSKNEMDNVASFSPRRYLSTMIKRAGAKFK